MKVLGSASLLINGPQFATVCVQISNNDKHGAQLQVDDEIWNVYDILFFNNDSDNFCLGASESRQKGMAAKVIIKIEVCAEAIPSKYGCWCAKMAINSEQRRNAPHFKSI